MNLAASTLSNSLAGGTLVRGNSCSQLKFRNTNWIIVKPPYTQTYTVVILIHLCSNSPALILGLGLRRMAGGTPGTGALGISTLYTQNNNNTQCKAHVHDAQITVAW